MPQADHDLLIVSKTGSPLYGRTDGVGVLPDAGGDSTLSDGLVAISNGDVARTLDPSMCCEVFEDFLGDRIIAATGSKDVDSSGWTYVLVNNPTAAIVANADNGVFALTLVNNAQETATLYWDDELNIDVDKEPVLVFRARLVCAAGGALDSATHVVMGFASATDPTTDSVAQNAWIRMEGANNNILLESDDATTNTDDKDSGVDYVDSTWYEFMVSMSSLHGASPTNVRFFYRSTLGGAWTELTNAGTTFKVLAATNVQPYFRIMKSSDANTDALQIDYARVWWKR